MDTRSVCRRVGRAAAALGLGVLTACGTSGSGRVPGEIAGRPRLPLQSCPSKSDYSVNPPQLVSAVEATAGLQSFEPTACAAPGPDSPCADHLIYEPNAALTPRAPLVVFLPGTNMEPNKHDLVLQTAAYAGYRTIGLSYDNTVSVADACDGLEECGLSCAGEVRTETILGSDSSANRDVLAGDSIVVRLYRLLEWLDANDPAGGWSSYFVPASGTVWPANILWADIIVGGFSQGAGHAAYIAHFFPVHGLVVLDGAAETCVDSATGLEEPAEWMTNGADASAGRPHYGVAHGRGTVLAATPASWQVQGFGTSMFLLDSTAFDLLDRTPPPKASYTNQDFPTTPSICSAHMSMARDDCMPGDVDATTVAADPPEARLFGPYLRRFCYACDATTCP